MIVTSSLLIYNTDDIKRALDTKITELSNDGYYNYLTFPYYTFELPSSNGPFWKHDSIVIKWDYSEPLDNLIPSTSIYLVNPIEERLVKRNVKTSAKNINYFLPAWMTENTDYHFRVETMFEGEKIFDTSSIFTVDDRYIDITTNAPFVPIVANQGRTFEIKWNGHGTGDYVKIDLLEFFELNTITIDGNIGRLIGNPAGNSEYTLEENVALNGDPSNPMVIATIEPKKYVGNDTSYLWTVDDIPYDVDSVRVKITDSYKPYVYDYTPPIRVLTPYVGIKNFMGRLLGQPVVSEVTYSGVSDALLTVYGFSPANRIVEETGSLTFNYDSTNAIQVFLTKASKANYSYVFPKLNGIYTIQNIKQDDIYTVNAKDTANKIRKATFDVKVGLEQTINNDDITNFTLVQLLNHSIALGQEALTAGDAIIEPGAPIIGKIAQYKIEASQMDEGTDYNVVKFLLGFVNEEILVVLLNGVETPPRVKLGNGNLRSRVIEANIVVSEELQTPPVFGPTVSGYITSKSVGIPDVVVSFNNDAGPNVITNTSGYYAKELPSRYTGEATVAHQSYNFVPQNKSYTDLKNDMMNENYTGIIKPVIPAVKKVVVNIDFTKDKKISSDDFIVFWALSNPTNKIYIRNNGGSGTYYFNYSDDIKFDFTKANNNSYTMSEGNIMKKRIIVAELPLPNIVVLPTELGDTIRVRVKLETY